MMEGREEAHLHVILSKSLNLRAVSGFFNYTMGLNILCHSVVGKI